MAWNGILENKEYILRKWGKQMQGEDLQKVYRAKKFIEYTEETGNLMKVDTDFVLKTLDCIKVFEDGMLLVRFLDGTEIECKNEEE
ncbi:hypothetical protein [Anaerocolumna sp.]|uniref:hypothetical protein n=1 Tax=Anaerocolumna sp. TaxID=2041569 RepID=UPI0028ADFE54|nr:hypothetical protein [Anaerocolumna sp.]